MKNAKLKITKIKMSSYDVWLTTPPDDGLDEWAEKVYEAYSTDFYDTVIGTTNWEGSDLETDWLVKLSGRAPEIAARIIERAYLIWFKKIAYE